MSFLIHTHDHWSKKCERCVLSCHHPFSTDRAKSHPLSFGVPVDCQADTPESDNSGVGTVHINFWSKEFHVACLSLKVWFGCSLVIGSVNECSSLCCTYQGRCCSVQAGFPSTYSHVSVFLIYPSPPLWSSSACRGLWFTMTVKSHGQSCGRRGQTH